MRRSTLAILAALAAGPVAAQETDSCGTAGFMGLVGQPGEIARMLVLEGPVRVIAPGDAVTRDYRRERINFDLDEDGAIIRIWCG